MKRVTEPVRKSLLDVVRKNLRAVERTTYITRVVYIGEYVGIHTNIMEKMELIIRGLQKDYTSVTISGLFLVYPHYYVHVLEAPEDIIYRHFTEVWYGGKLTDCEMKRAIFLPTYHHVHQRFFNSWAELYTVPPTLMQKLESYELDDIKQYVTNCYNKTYMLCDRLSKVMRDHSVAMKEIARTLGDTLTRLYPESTLIEYLLSAKSPVLMTVEEYIKIHSTIPLIKLYADTIWPSPRDLIFCDGFEAQNQGIIKDKET